MNQLTQQISALLTLALQEPREGRQDDIRAVGEHIAATLRDRGQEGEANHICAVLAGRRSETQKRRYKRILSLAKHRSLGLAWAEAEAAMNEELRNTPCCR